MKRQFFGANEGLDRRFTRRIVYPNASPVEMTNVWWSQMGDSRVKWSSTTKEMLCHILCLAKTPRATYDAKMLSGGPDDEWRSIGVQQLFQRRLWQAVRVDAHPGRNLRAPHVAATQSSDSTAGEMEVDPDGTYGPTELYEVLAGLAMEYARSATQRQALEREFRNAPIGNERTEWASPTASMKTVIDVVKQPPGELGESQQLVDLAHERKAGRNRVVGIGSTRNAPRHRWSSAQRPVDSQPR